jgi:hypothetical protein
MEKKVYKIFNFLILFIAFLMRKVFHNLRKYNFTFFFVNERREIEKLNEFLNFVLKLKWILHHIEVILCESPDRGQVK